MLERASVRAALLLLSVAGFACENDPATTSVSDAGSKESGGAGAPATAAGSGGSGASAGKAGSAGNGKAGTGGAAAGHAGSDSADVSVERAAIDADAMPKIDDAAYSALITQLNQFGLELGLRQAETNQLTQKNCVYSPLSASIALSMTYAGARSETATELRTLLSNGMPAETYHAGINRLARELASRAQDGKDASGNPRKIELNIADAVYLDTQLAVVPELLDQLARNYDTGVHRADFRHAFEDARMQINDWVAVETHDKIQNLLAQGTLSELTRLVLVNALYFYGSWLNTFNPMATSDADFHTLANGSVSVPTMVRQASLGYATGSDYTSVELPYVGDHLSMLIVLPNEGKFESVRKAVSATWLKSAVDAVQGKTVRLALPKFKMTVGAFSLTQSLEDMGLKSAFSDKADFTGISADEPLQISAVVQKAFISVDENGTEAAAATAVSVGTTSAPLEVIEVNVNRPFLFFIRDDNGTVLFSGHVVDPSKAE